MNPLIQLALTWTAGLTLCQCSSLPEPVDTQKPAAQSPSPEQSLGKSGELWESYDEEKFPFTAWKPKNGKEPDAVIIGVHGLSGAADDYRPLGQYFENHDTVVYSYELRGQGNDPKKRRRGDIRSPKRWYADLDTFLTLVRKEHPGTPVFLYGESLGSLIIMHGLTHFSEDNRSAVCGCIFASPIVGLKEQLPPVADFFVHLLMRMAPWFKVSLETLGGDHPMQVTGDTTHKEQMAVTPHYVNKFTLRLLGHVENMIEDCAEAAAEIEEPILLLYPAHDVISGTEHVEAFFAGLPCEDKEKCLFKDSYHLLLHDDESEKVLATIHRWMERKTPGSGE